METLRNRWLSLWGACEFVGDGEAVFEMIRTRYSEPHRAYHTLGHVGHCLVEFDEVRHELPVPQAAELALWFHDIFYDTRSPDNERRSAELACTIITEAGHPELGNFVHELILDTAHHKPPQSTIGGYVVDIDLSILGADYGRFDAYEKHICKEYEWVPDEVFRARRALILEKFLEREHIYETVHFQKKYEVVARKNLVRSIRTLRAGSS